MARRRAKRGFQTKRAAILITSGALALCFGILLLIIALAGGRETAEAVMPADLEPAEAMGLVMAQDGGVPLEAAGAACKVRSLSYAQASLQFEPDGGSIRDYLASAFSGRSLKRAEAQAERLSVIGAVARGKVFPLPEDVNYDYSDGWGMGRPDQRRHEGIDIFADMGEPVRSVCSGVVEKKGWLNLGGWRIGIRGDDDGIYYYYAHMSAYADVEIGDHVEKGQVVGFVGDTGYGPEGTTGQFVPHLHFGMYQGVEEEGTERAFSPFPYLTLWDPRRSPDLESLRKD